MKKRALLSVSDKTGILDFARGLVSLGYEVVSTGGTQKVIEGAGIPVTNISDVTGFPECLDGRVKTLHPLVHAGILAIRESDEHMRQIQDLNITLIDVVAINLYPFKQTILRTDVTLEEAIENIDIGGPTMIRAAAKNWQDVVVLVDPADYNLVLNGIEKGELERDVKFSLARKVFSYTAAYDAMISRWLDDYAGVSRFPENLTMTFEKAQDLRYGENPHQQAAFYKEIEVPQNSLAAAIQLHGKELSFNNINDANGALDVLKEFGSDTPCAVAVKHANPCGVGLGDTLLEAYNKAYQSDPVSIYGGIVALNRKVDLDTARQLGAIFLEIIIAPDYDEDALSHLKEKKNIRLLQLPGCALPNNKNSVDIKKVVGGLLVQDLDTTQFLADNLQVVTERAPTDEEMTQMKIAMKVVKHIKSNGICLVRDFATVGVGPGQTNRVTALDLAIGYAGERAKGSVMGSDAFFPFADCVEHAKKAGVTAIIQPGGSVRDAESISACNKAGIAMVFTGVRHFKH
jgi:phosphoribosylaminoimidazolecarboxamide formyltransferase/IMP cyclohydrolase